MYKLTPVEIVGSNKSFTPEIHIPQFTVVSTRDRVPTKTGLYYLYEGGDVELARSCLIQKITSQSPRMLLNDLPDARYYSASEYDHLYSLGFNPIHCIPGTGIFVNDHEIYHESGSRHRLYIFVVARTLIERLDAIRDQHSGFSPKTEETLVGISSQLIHSVMELNGTDEFSDYSVVGSPIDYGCYVITLHQLFFGTISLSFNLLDGSIRMDRKNLDIYQALYPNSTKLALLGTG